jgi:hypothetical protein
MSRRTMAPSGARQGLREGYARHAESNAIKRDEIAGRQMGAVRKYSVRKPVRIPDIKEVFEAMRDHIGGAKKATE